MLVSDRRGMDAPRAARPDVSDDRRARCRSRASASRTTQRRAVRYRHDTRASPLEWRGDASGCDAPRLIVGSAAAPVPLATRPHGLIAGQGGEVTQHRPVDRVGAARFEVDQMRSEQASHLVSRVPLVEYPVSVELGDHPFGGSPSTTIGDPATPSSSMNPRRLARMIHRHFTPLIRFPSRSHRRTPGDKFPWKRPPTRTTGLRSAVTGVPPSRQAARFFAAVEP
jgi:hypothetical protein